MISDTDGLEYSFLTSFRYCVMCNLVIDELFGNLKAMSNEEDKKYLNVKCLETDI